MRGTIARIAPELHELIKARCQIHNTKFTQESRNVARILSDIQPITGDIKQVKVIDRAVFPNNRLFRIK